MLYYTQPFYKLQKTRKKKRKKREKLTLCLPWNANKFTNAWWRMRLFAACYYNYGIKCLFLKYTKVTGGTMPILNYSMSFVQIPTHMSDT